MTMSIKPLCQVTQELSPLLKRFDCGVPFLNQFARKKLVKRHQQDLHKALLALTDSAIAGYATTKTNILVCEDIDPMLAGSASLPPQLPTISLEQIATDLRFQRQGVGSQLLKEVLCIVAKVSEQTGVYGLHLWAHPDSVVFYQKLGFISLQKETRAGLELTLMFLSAATIRNAIN
ncbi:GNAT family N-acetyltransferase [Pseudidiomarina donghaiensis]|uniref:GNAT family N-acetyltransferase n=1 Tax=Pseudidiomarina donghaiensis TaxID=519452 RepID=A0A432XGX4_9GAMM|nr:GNAT family N-acetyltransferase [Pseudidiomarina donghaiensis]RUO47930.1 GNAT family N-acetyltransferase [Pseudidiomarina donghaiensis]SFV22644.1 Acetyltransferase (GNAT) family protein [Pseudidiomarina donghaiensis]